MSLATRIVLGLVFLTAIGSAAVFLFSADEPQATSQPTGATEVRMWQSARQCQECHQDVWDEWWGSHHQIAYTNPEVRALSEDFRRKECQACHLPQPVAITGFGQRALPRKTRPVEGIGCIECHIDANGRVMGTRDMPDVACAPIASPDLVSIDHCASCHNQHGTTDQYRDSAFAQDGVHCNDCHMPEVDRTTADGSRKGRHHGYPGAHDLTMLKRAAEFTVEMTGSDLLLAVENTWAGHNFPTEERHRAVDVMYRFVTADGGASEWQLAMRFRQPYRDEPGENTQLPAGERWEQRVAVPDDAVRAEARLWYRLKPMVGDEDPASTLLFERRVEVR